MKRLESPHRGFTLVELLVVVGIIAVMIAMLMPAMRRVRAQARSVACMGNLRQLSIGLSTYAVENQMTVAHGTNSFDGNSHPWYFMLDGRAVNRKVYVSGPKLNDYSNNSSTVFRCPNMDYPDMYTPQSAWVSSVYAMVDGTDKAKDPAAVSTSTPGTAMEAIRLAAIRKSSTYPLLFDSSAFSTSYANAGDAGHVDGRYRLGGTSFSGEGIIRPGGGPWAYQAHGIWLAHDGRANGVFADFHVESCDGPMLQRCSTPNRFTSGKTGIAAWKTEAGVEVVTSF